MSFWWVNEHFQYNLFILSLNCSNKFVKWVGVILSLTSQVTFLIVKIKFIKFNLNDFSVGVLINLRSKI